MTVDTAAFLSTWWAQAMLAMLPLFALHRGVGGRWPTHRLRTWTALFGTSLSSWMVTPAVGATPFLLYALICFAGAAIVMVRPAGTAQRAIAMIFAFMAAFNGGAYLAGEPNGGPVYSAMLHYAGWSQLFILLFWGCTNVEFGKIASCRFHRLGGYAGHSFGAGKRG